MQADYHEEPRPYSGGSNGLDDFAPPPVEHRGPPTGAYAKALERVRSGRTYGDQASRMAESFEVVGQKLQAEADGRDFATTNHAPGTTLPDRPAVLHRGFAAAIVEASTVLTSNQKRLYRRYLELDRPRGYRSGGCFAKVETLARRLGMSPGSVKRDRRTLCHYGMLCRTPEGVSPVRWFPTLPPSVVGTKPEAVAKGKPTDAWILAQALQLDAVLSAQAREMKAAKAPSKASERAETICTPGSDNLYPDGAQIVPGEGTNCSPVLPRLRPLRPAKVRAA
jgi:hypothetical protein